MNPYFLSILGVVALVISHRWLYRYAYRKGVEMTLQAWRETLYEGAEFIDVKRDIEPGGKDID